MRLRRIKVWVVFFFFPTKYYYLFSVTLHTARTFIGSWKNCVKSLYLGKDMLPGPADRVRISEGRSDTDDSHVTVFWICQTCWLTCCLPLAERVRMVSGGKLNVKAGVDGVDNNLSVLVRFKNRVLC